MISNSDIPRIYLITQRIAIQETISHELGSDPLEIILMRDEHQFFESVDEKTRCCIIVDISTNSADDLNRIAAIKLLRKNASVIALSDHWKVATAVKAIKLGAIDICELSSMGRDLRQAIKDALALGSQSILSENQEVPPSVACRVSSEESRILKLMLKGLTAKEIGAAMDVSIRTFHYRKQSILHKLGVKNRFELIELIRLASEGDSLYKFRSIRTDPEHVAAISVPVFPNTTQHAYNNFS
jgi:two-component system response regulator FixJ